MTTVTDSKMRSTSNVHAAFPISACKDQRCLPHQQGRIGSENDHCTHRPIQRLVYIYALIPLVLITAFPGLLRASTLHSAESVTRSSTQSSSRSAAYEPRFSMDQNSVAQALDLFSPGSTLETQLRQGFSDGITEILQVGLSSAGIDIVRQEAKQRLKLTSIDQLIMVVTSQAATDGKTAILVRVDTLALLTNEVCVTVMRQLSEADTSVFRKSCQPYQDISKFFE